MTSWDSAGGPSPPTAPRRGDGASHSATTICSRRETASSRKTRPRASQQISADAAAQTQGVSVLGRREPRRLEHLIELQRARPFALPDLTPEGGPQPGGAVGPPRQSTLTRDAGSRARDFLIVEQE